MTLRELQPGEAVFHKDDQSSTLYFVEEGRFRAVQSGQTLRTMDAGAFFGEFAFFQAVLQNAERHGSFSDFVEVAQVTNSQTLALLSCCITILLASWLLRMSVSCDGFSDLVQAV